MFRLTHTVATLLTYGFLYATVIALWLPKFKKISVWWLFLVAAIILGLICHRLDFLALLFIFLLGLSAYLLKDKNLTIFIRVIAAVVLLILAIGLEAHLIPGFYNLRVLNRVQMSSDGVPFTLYLNFDKTVVGIFILGSLHPLIATRSEWVNLFKATLPRACVVIVAVACLVFALKFVHFDPKLPRSLFIWAITNLLFVCLAEEALFRGFIQRYLGIVLQHFSWGNGLAILIASILFGLAHYAGGSKYMLLAAVAGLGYGWIYFRTKRIEASMLTHFCLNLVHFLLFTYPALAGAFK